MIGDFSKFVLGRQSRRLLALGLIAGGLSLTACGDDDEPKPTPTPDMGEEDMGENNNNETPAALTISPIMQNFGSVLVGETSAASTFTVTNSGQAASSAVAVGIEGAASADFAITANTCAGATVAGGATCTISVTFAPGDVGARAASLSVSAEDGGEASATLEGSGAGEGDLTITPSLGAFGDIIVGETSDIQVFTITNPGSAATDALSTTVTGDHAPSYTVSADTCAGTELAAGATCEVSIAFSPDSRGDKSATLAVAGGGLSVTGGLSGRGLNDAAISVSAANHNFGNLTVGNTSNPFTFTVTNTGDVEAAAISSNVTGDAGDFGVNSTCGATLAAGASCTVSVAFAPQSEGAKSATLDVTANPGGSVSATVTGTGLSLGDIGTSANSHDFGSTMAGTTGTSETFTFTNNGGSQTGILATALAGTNASSFTIVAGSNSCQGITLASGASCTVTVEFAPSTEGVKNASLAVSGNPGGSSVVSLEGTATAVIAPAEFELTPASRNFGSVATGSESAPLTFTVTNIGGETTAVPVVDIVTQDFADFTIAANGCSVALAAGDDCEVQVRFVPTGNPGTRSSTLRVQGASGGAGGTDSSVLQGVALSPAALNLATGGQSTQNFGNWINGSESTVQTRTFINNGTQATDPIVTSVTGQFIIDSDTCDGATLANGQQCTVEFQFAPTTRGAQTGTLTVDGGVGGSVDVGLSGNSLAEYTFTVIPTNDDGDFGDVVVGQNATKTFRVTNASGSGEITRTVTQSFSGTHAAQFTFTPTTPGTGDCRHATGGVLAAGASCDLTVQFTPTGTHGDRTGSLDIGVTAGLTDAIALEGFALVRSNNLTFNPATYNYNANGADLIGDIDSHVFTLTNNSTLVNSGTLTVEFTGGQNFGITQNNCAGNDLAPAPNGNTCTITVNFYPTASQTYNGNIVVMNEVATVADATFEGTGVAPAAIEITGDQSFGDVPATVTRSRTYTIRNTGEQESGQLSIGLAAGSTGFALTSVAAENTCPTDAAGLDGGESCTVVVNFLQNASVTLGTKTGTLQVGSVNADTETRALSANAISQLSITTSGDFGNQRAGTISALRAFQIANAGTVAVVGPGALVTGSATNFEGAATNTCNAITIPAGGSATCISRAFSPGSGTSGALTAAIEIHPTGTNPGWETSLTLNGTSIRPNLNFDMTSTDFGPLTVGQTLTRAYTLTNSGTDAALALNLTGTNANFGITHNCGTSIAASASCTVTVVYQPQTAASHSLSFTVADDNGLSSATLDLSGEGLSAGGLRVTPNQVVFPDTEVGTESAVQTFTVHNDNIVAATALVFSPANPTHFCRADTGAGACTGTTVNNCVGEDLAPGATCTFGVRFRPTTDGGNDLKTSTVTISSSTSQPGMHAAEADLIGLRLDNADVGITGVVSFADTAANATRTETYTVTNSGGVPSAALATTLLGGLNGARFSVTSDTCNGVALPASGDCKIDVTFNPANNELDAENTLQVLAGVTFAFNAESVAITTLTISSATSNCGTQNAGNSILCPSFTFTNSGAVATAPVSLALTGDAQFEIINTNCRSLDMAGNFVGTEIGANQSCFVQIRYLSNTIGDHNGTLTATSGQLVSTGTLTGKTIAALVNDAEIPAGTNPVTPAVPGAHSFGSVGVLCSDDETFTFTNESVTLVSGVLSVELDSDQFTWQSSCPGDELEANSHDDCTVTVFFVPTSAGAKSATLTVSGAGGGAEMTSTVDLSGTGTTAPCAPLPR